MQNIELSPAEIEMIKIKREQETKTQLAREKEVIKLKLSIEKFLKENENSTKLIKDNFEILKIKHPNLYQLTITDKEKDFQYETYYTDSEKEKLGISDKYSKFIYATIPTNYEYVTISRIDNSKFKIIALNGNLYVNGIDYKNDNKSLKNIFTAHKNIQEHIDTVIRENNAKQNEEIGHNLLFDELTKEFANDNVIITKKNEYSGGYYKKLVHVEFQNGLKVNYVFRFYQNVFSKRIDKIETQNLDQNKLIQALKSI